MKETIDNINKKLLWKLKIYKIQYLAKLTMVDNHHINVAVAIIVKLGFYVIAKFIKKIVGKSLSKFTDNKTVTGLAQSLLGTFL